MSNEPESPDDDLLAEARSELDDPVERKPRAYILACRLQDIPKNGSRGKVIFCENDEVALFRFGETVYAISNICPHQLSPLLSEGHIDKEALTVACPLHGWTYHIPSGRSVIGSGSVPSYDVKLDGDEVWIEEPLPQAPLMPTWFEPDADTPDPFE